MYMYSICIAFHIRIYEITLLYKTKKNKSGDNEAYQDVAGSFKFKTGYADSKYVVTE